ncbi:hypothetical protein ES706_03505 [subsurface metagenome]
MTRKAGRPKGSTNESDFELLQAFLFRPSMRFNEVVKRSGLARGTVASRLEHFTKAGFISKSEGKRPVYQLINGKRAFDFYDKKMSEMVASVKRDIDRLKFMGLPRSMRKAEEEMFKGVPEDMAFEDVYGFHPPSTRALLYACKRHPKLWEFLSEVSRIRSPPPPDSETGVQLSGKITFDTKAKEKSLLEWTLKWFKEHGRTLRENKKKAIPWLERSGRSVEMPPGVREKAALLTVNRNEVRNAESAPEKAKSRLKGKRRMG